MIPPALTAVDLQDVLGVGHEQNGFEFKGPGRVDDKPLIYRIIRAMCGMANRRDGGRVVIGVIDEPGHFERVGVSPEQRATWTHDLLAGAAAPYTDPGIEFSVQIVTLSEKDLIVLHVAEFDSEPVVCRRQYQDILRNGALYIRPSGKHETREAQTSAELRVVLSLAIDKGVARWAATARSAGIVSDLATPTAPDDAARFAAQANELE